MACTEEELMFALYDRELEDAEASRARAHLESCADCQATWQGLRSVSVFSRVAPLELAGFTDLVRQRVSPPPQGPDPARAMIWALALAPALCCGSTWGLLLWGACTALLAALAADRGRHRMAFERARWTWPALLESGYLTPSAIERRVRETLRGWNIPLFASGLCAGLVWLLTTGVGAGLQPLLLLLIPLVVVRCGARAGLLAEAWEGPTAGVALLGFGLKALVGWLASAGVLKALAGLAHLSQAIAPPAALTLALGGVVAAGWWIRPAIGLSTCERLTRFAALGALAGHLGSRLDDLPETLESWLDLGGVLGGLLALAWVGSRLASFLLGSPRQAPLPLRLLAGLAVGALLDRALPLLGGMEFVLPVSSDGVLESLAQADNPLPVLVGGLLGALVSPATRGSVSDEVPVGAALRVRLVAAALLGAAVWHIKPLPLLPEQGLQAMAPALLRPQYPVPPLNPKMLQAAARLAGCRSWSDVATLTTSLEGLAPGEWEAFPAELRRRLARSADGAESNSVLGKGRPLTFEQARQRCRLRLALSVFVKGMEHKALREMLDFLGDQPMTREQALPWEAVNAAKRLSDRRQEEIASWFSLADFDNQPPQSLGERWQQLRQRRRTFRYLQKLVDPARSINGEIPSISVEQQEDEVYLATLNLLAQQALGMPERTQLPGGTHLVVSDGRVDALFPWASRPLRCFPHPEQLGER